MNKPDEMREAFERDWLLQGNILPEQRSGEYKCSITNEAYVQFCRGYQAALPQRQPTKSTQLLNHLSDLTVWAEVGVQTVPRGKTIPDVQWLDAQIRESLMQRQPISEDEAVELMAKAISDSTAQIVGSNAETMWDARKSMFILDARAAYRAILPHLSQGGWQDIASAPRDGEDVLVLTADEKRHIAHVGRSKANDKNWFYPNGQPVKYIPLWWMSLDFLPPSPNEEK